MLSRYFSIESRELLDKPQCAFPVFIGSHKMAAAGESRYRGFLQQSGIVFGHANRSRGIRVSVQQFNVMLNFGKMMAVVGDQSMKIQMKAPDPLHASLGCTL